MTIPMRKWCHICEEFKDNPKNKKNPKYCEECLEKIYIKAHIKRREGYKKTKGLNTN